MSGLRGAVGAASSLWRSTGSSRAPRLLWCAVVASLVLLGLEVAFAVLLDPRPGLIATTFVNAIIQMAGAVACFWTAPAPAPATGAGECSSVSWLAARWSPASRWR